MSYNAIFIVFYFRIETAHKYAKQRAKVQARSQDCKFGEGSFSVWGQTYFEYMYYYTAIAF